MVKNHARKREARRQRQTHPGHNHRQAIAATRRDQDAELVVYVPYPQPELAGASPCPSCSGQGITGSRYEEPYQPPTPLGAVALIIDIVCGTCGGCGRAEHSECAAGTHAGEDPADPGAYDDQDDEPDDENCLSCHGRQFWIDQAIGEPTAAHRRAEQELADRARARGLADHQVAGAAAVGQLDCLLGAGAQDLAAAADTTVWLRMPCGCAEDRARTVRRDELAAIA